MRSFIAENADGQQAIIGLNGKELVPFGDYQYIYANYDATVAVTRDSEGGYLVWIMDYEDTVKIITHMVYRRQGAECSLPPFSVDFRLPPYRSRILASPKQQNPGDISRGWNKPKSKSTRQSRTIRSVPPARYTHTRAPAPRSYSSACPGSSLRRW